MSLSISVWGMTKKIGALFLALVICWAAVRTFKHYVLGYPNHTSSPIDAAVWLAERKLKPELCRKIAPNFMFGSQPAEQKAECIFQYAKLTKDPSACELLMPSSYGLSCVGAAESQPDLCSMSNGSVAWNGGKETYASCADHSKKRTAEGDACCLIARVTFVKSENDCSPLLSSPEFRDECLKNLAFKNHAPETCADIQNGNRRSACEVQARAIEQNPTICEGCKKPVNDLSELQ